MKSFAKFIIIILLLLGATLSVIGIICLCIDALIEAEECLIYKMYSEL